MFIFTVVAVIGACRSNPSYVTVLGVLAACVSLWSTFSKMRMMVMQSSTLDANWDFPLYLHVEQFREGRVVHQDAIDSHELS